MGYGEWPCIFKGRALYQLQLVKSDEARKYIPGGLKMVEMFGYTLGGMYLARYSDSPAGSFDEVRQSTTQMDAWRPESPRTAGMGGLLASFRPGGWAMVKAVRRYSRQRQHEMVALCGLVWNPPTSCAWAARVYVNNREARDHGVRHVGLPSRVAQFSESAQLQQQGQQGSGRHRGGGGSGRQSWWYQHGGSPARVSVRRVKGGACRAASEPDTPTSSPAWDIAVVNKERGRRGYRPGPLCSLLLPPARRPGVWAGPRFKMFLPSFSGGTPECPGLLFYSCNLLANIRPVEPIAMLPQREEAGTQRDHGDAGEALAWLHSSKPLICLAFDNMEMHVGAPDPVDVHGRRPQASPCAA